MRNLKVTVNGVEYDVQVEEVSSNNNETSINQNQVSIDKAEPTKQAESEPILQENNNEQQVSSDSEKISAPMPGTIINVLVTEGQKVSEGDVLLILEAMKMENEIASPIDGVIEKINVTKGQSVETGENLIYIK